MAHSVSIAIVGSGGAGSITAGEMILNTAAKAGYYGIQTRSVGPQIRGGEAAALLRLSTSPVAGHDNYFNIILAIDWDNAGRFVDELPTGPDTIILTDPAMGEVPAKLLEKGATVHALPMKELAKTVAGGRSNSVAIGALLQMAGLSFEIFSDVLHKKLARKGEVAILATLDVAQAGADAAAAFGDSCKLAPVEAKTEGRWIITGNQAAGLGAVRGGVRFAAAYPITPASDMLEWLATQLPKLGGELVQAEDELASINMVIGGSFAGQASMTATSGPGLALMIEALGLAVASETPAVVVNVMRGGPSTGIPTKSEQSDLNMAVYGMSGDAPHLVLAPQDVTDCIDTTEWSVRLAEHLQCPAIVLSDQFMGQAVSIIDAPADDKVPALPRKVPEAREGEAAAEAGYDRFAYTDDHVSPMAVPGTAGCQYTSTGLEHSPNARPSSEAPTHIKQMDKRLKKLTDFDYGDLWADVQGEGEIAVITWGSTAAPVKEALAQLEAEEGLKVRFVAPRLLAPALPDQMGKALEGVSKILVVEQTHSAQFHHYLRAFYDLPGQVKNYALPGPLRITPAEIKAQLKDWS